MEQLKLEEIPSKDSELRGMVKKVYAILRNHPETRKSDKDVVWHYWSKYGQMEIISLNGEPVRVINKADFMHNTLHDSITCACRIVRRLYPELAGDKKVRHARAIREIDFKELSRVKDRLNICEES